MITLMRNADMYPDDLPWQFMLFLHLYFEKNTIKHWKECYGLFPPGSDTYDLFEMDKNCGIYCKN